MYNTQFKVKYNDIETELLANKNKKQTNLDEECQYSSQDILDICNKLYRDEFLSVFGLEDFDDYKINEIISIIYDKMMTNVKFKEIVDEIAQVCLKDFFLNTEIILREDKEKDKEKEEAIKKQIILATLFSQPLFHITHKCVCQQFELGTIDTDLLVEFKTHFITLLHIS